MTSVPEQYIERLLKVKDYEKAFHLVVEHYQEPMYWTIRNIVITHENADDVLQNTFIKAWNALPKFKGESTVKTWLHRIAVNESLSFLQKEKRHAKSNSSEINETLLNQLESDVYYEGDEMQKKLRLAVDALPEKQHLIFSLKYFDDLKYQDIQEITGGSIGSLKASYHHAVKKIKEFLDLD